MKNPLSKNTTSSRSIPYRSVFGGLVLLIFLAAAQGAFAATFTVNDSGDVTDITPGDGICETATGNGICTLRAAVVEANALAGDDVINFDAGISLITLTSGSEIFISSNVSISGTGAHNLTIAGTTGANRIFFIQNATVTIQGVTLSGGNGFGSAVYSANSTTNLEAVVAQNNVGNTIVFFNNGGRIADSTIAGNTGNGCVAVQTFGAFVTVVNTTVSGNSSTGGQGAICIDTGLLTFRNTTVSGNTSSGIYGGGIYITTNPFIFITRVVADFGNTIVAGNTSADGGADLYRAHTRAGFTTSGGNLIGDNSGNPSAPNTTTFPTGNPNANGDKVGDAANPINPMLGPLQNNGGRTPTRALLTGSPAIDAGINANATGLTFDQRGTGFPRIIDGDGNGTATVDIGAFEVQQAPTAAHVSIGGRVTTAKGRAIRNVWITLTDSGGISRTAITSTFGYYSFNDVAAGGDYMISVGSKGYTFNEPTRYVYIIDSVDDMNFVGW